MTLSVAMCTYNGAPFLGAQLDSLRRQTRLPDELIISDDHSDDETIPIVRAFADTAPFAVRILINEERLGVIRNFERAVAACTGDLVALSDQDDVWHVTKLERMAAALQARSAGLAICNSELVDEQLVPLGARLIAPNLGAGIARGEMFELLLKNIFPAGHALVFRTELRQRCFPFPTDLAGVSYDGWIALVAAACNDTVYVDALLVEHRQHSGQSHGVHKWRTNSPEIRPATDFSDAIAIADRLLGALSKPGPGDPARIRRSCERLSSFEAHLRRRKTLPASLVRRVPVVVKELLSTNYHRHGRGLLSAAKDLVKGAATGKGQAS
jgi:glycosyltransferase involved in cell wall biosynthesis